jgi:tetratricopeptide (TPR) repeat protein
MRCHAGAYPKAPVINPALHTFHTPQSAGSRCVNCHMPQTAYMQRHNRHDHGFTTPDPLLTKQIGVPNACNRCHGDKNADWSLSAVEKWYGPKMDRPSRKRAIIVAAARRHEAWSKPALLELLGEPAAGGYWKSGFLRLLEQWTDDPAVRNAVIGHLNDADPMARESAVTALTPFVVYEDVARAITAALDDPSRNVRIAAAHALQARLGPSSAAATDFLRCLDQQSDEPIGRLALARFFVDHNDAGPAATHLQKAIEFDPRSAGLRRDAAVLFGRIKRPLDALAQMNEACRLEPGNSEFWMLAGLAASEAGQADQAMAAFEKAVGVDPHNSRAWYNLGIARQKAKQDETALIAYANAEAADPLDADIPYARATLLARLNRRAEAREAVIRALKISPEYPQAAQLLQALQATP